MGEIAEAMLDGTLCEGCGEFLGGAEGFPGYCSEDCARGRGMRYTPPRRRKAIPDQGKPFECGICARRFRHAISLAQHERDKHQVMRG